MLDTYREFLAQKQIQVIESGLPIDESELHPEMFKFQKWVTARSLRLGKSAIFADCGTGKTFMQLEWAQKVHDHTAMPVLILAPLAVSQQTIQEGARFGYPVSKLSEQSDNGIFITNYEQVDKYDVSVFAGIVLDESSILKNFDGETKKLIIDRFAQTPYKLACTATPSPNDAMELGNHAEFLNITSRNEMLATYFVHDGGDTAKWRLKRHSQKLFYEWVASWAVMFTKPSDIGFSAEGYDLPLLNFIETEIETENISDNLFCNDTAVSATDFNKELRRTKMERLNHAANIVNNSTENFIVWVKQNEEADYLKKLIPDAVEVRGSDSIEVKEKRLLGFANNEFRVLITKSKIAQFGLNYQNCHNQVFPSLDFSFEALYQSIKRSHRFGQTEEVNIYLITTDTMQNVVQAVKEKQEQFEIMQNEMSLAVNQTMHHETKVIAPELDGQEYRSEYCHLHKGDCVELIHDLPSESIGLSVFSPPFADLYTYSDSLADMGNSRNYEEFLVAFRFLVAELYRVMIQGRLVAVHCADLPIQKGKEGFIGLRDFSNMIRETFEDAGFIYHTRVTIWKNPVTEMQRTKALGLLHKQLRKDATMSRVGIPDYLLVFRKDGEDKQPVQTMIDVDTWQKWASPVWWDINYSNTLHKIEARDQKDEKHICPLQLETIERAIALWTNEGDTILSPFAGIGSELFQAIKMNRKAIGFELKQSYFDLAVKNIKAVESDKAQEMLFVV